MRKHARYALYQPISVIARQKFRQVQDRQKPIDGKAWHSDWLSPFTVESLSLSNHIRQTPRYHELIVNRTRLYSVHSVNSALTFHFLIIDARGIREATRIDFGDTLDHVSGSRRVLSRKWSTDNSSLKTHRRCRNRRRVLPSLLLHFFPLLQKSFFR